MVRPPPSGALVRVAMPFPMTASLRASCTGAESCTVGQHSATLSSELRSDHHVDEKVTRPAQEHSDQGDRVDLVVGLGQIVPGYERVDFLAETNGGGSLEHDKAAHDSDQDQGHTSTLQVTALSRRIVPTSSVASDSGYAGLSAHFVYSISFALTNCHPFVIIVGWMITVH